MSHTDILSQLEAVPFRPFRIHVSDGKSFEITHPDQVIVTPYKLIVGVGETRGHYAQHIEHCSLAHVTRLEETPA